jgi:hypothetical protein
MMMSRTRLSAALLTAALAAQLSVSKQAAAAQLDYRANLGAGHSDNIRRVEEDEVDEDIVGASVQFSLNQRSPSLEADVIGDVGYYEYLDDTYDSEVLGNVIANTRYNFVPERFSWVLDDNFGQVLGDAFSPATPDNRENINYLSTGPDLTLPLGSQMRFRVGARYGMTAYERSDLDSTNVSAQLALVRLLSSSSSVSLNANQRNVEYDEERLDADYDQTELFLQYSALGARTQMTADIGYTQIDRDATQDAEDGLLARISATRRLSSASTIQLDLGREFTSSAGAFASDQGFGGLQAGTGQGQQTAEPFTNDTVRAAWDFRRNRTALNLYGSWDERTYDDPSLDQTLMTGGGRISREMSRTTTLDVGATYSDAQFEQGVTDYHQLDATLGFVWRLSSTLTFQATYIYSDRTSDAPLGDYTENRIWLSLGYGRGVPRTILQGPNFAVDSANP